jgi:cytoskeletal protein RodZ
VKDVRTSGQDSSSQENSGGSPGTILRRCREFHGITLEEAAETTKIGISHLKSLEDDLIREFANQAYLKGFLRIYATYLGLNSDDIARMYDKLFDLKVEKAESAHTGSTPSRPARRKIPLKKLLFPALLLGVILIAAPFFRRQHAPSARPAQPLATVATPVQKAAVQTVQSSVRAKKSAEDIQPRTPEKVPEETPVPEKTAAPKHPQDAAKGFILKIKVSQNGELTATVDGSASQQYELTSGDIIEWKAEKKITLELSNAGGVDVELNGKPHQPLGPHGKQIYVEFDADNIK